MNGSPAWTGPPLPPELHDHDFVIVKGVLSPEECELRIKEYDADK
jgi:hypothetical protein